MSPLEKVLSRLKCTRKSGSGWVALCPAHNDHNPSLSINETDEGHVLLHCFTGCSIESITNAIDLKPSELFARKNERTMNKEPNFGFENTKKTKGFDTPEKALQVHERTLGQHSAKWDYHNIDGMIVGWAVRWETKPTKTFRPVSLIDGRWRPIGMPAFRPLYHLPELAGAELVIVTEGEKAADAAGSLGFVATTSFGGSGAPHHTSWQPLAGKKVVILPDNDEPGEEYAEAVLNILQGLTTRPQIQVVRLPDLPEKGDIVNWIENHGDAVEPEALRANLLKLIEEKPIWKPTQADPKPDLSFRPFPLDILPEPIRSFVRDGAKSLMCDPTYILLPLLTMLGACIGNTRRLKVRSEWFVPPILWTMIVGQSGTSKSPAFRLGIRSLEHEEDLAFQIYSQKLEEYQTDSQVYERSISDWKKSKSTDDLPSKPKKPTLGRYSVIDVTFESLAAKLAENPRGLLLHRDELSGLFGSFDRYAGKGKITADASNFLTTFNAGPVMVDRKTNDLCLRIPRAALSITGGIQPELLKKVLDSEHKNSGMAARFLFTYPDKIMREWHEDEFSEKHKQRMENIVRKLCRKKGANENDLDLEPINLGFTPSARERWIRYYNLHNLEHQEKESDDLSSAWSKLEEYPLRVSLIIHCVRIANDDLSVNPMQVDEHSLEVGIRFIEWCKHETERIYAMLDGVSVGVDKNEQKLLAHIRKHGGKLSPREVRLGCRWLRESSETAKNALDQLVQKGLGTWEIKGERRTFILNPDPPENPIDPDPEPPCEIPRDSNNRDSEPKPPPTPKSVDVDTVDTVDGVDTLASESVDVDSVDAVDGVTTNNEPVLNNDNNNLWETEPLFPEIPRLPD